MLPSALRFPQIFISVISRDASVRDATSSIFNDLQAAGATRNLVGRRESEKHRGIITLSRGSFQFQLSRFLSRRGKMQHCFLGT